MTFNELSLLSEISLIKTMSLVFRFDSD